MRSSTTHLLRQSWHDWIRGDLRDPVAPAWMLWIWTGLLALVLAAVFLLLGMTLSSRSLGELLSSGRLSTWYGQNLVVSACVSALIHALFELARLGLRGRTSPDRWRPWQRSAFFAGIPLTGVLIGWPLGLVLIGMDLGRAFGTTAGLRMVSLSLGLSLVLSLLMHLWAGARTARIDAQREATEARLKLLQGQIEPHFLFNSLAGIDALVEADPPAARRALRNFTDYLRSVLHALRRDQAPLRDELTLVQHYLTLMQSRMEDRLDFHIVDLADCGDRSVPPLLLQPLVENAVRHGIEPSLEGGRIDVRIERQDSVLILEVADTGVGLTADPAPEASSAPEHTSPLPARPRSAATGNGLATHNLRERLAAHYGASAQLTLGPRPDGRRGAVARIRLPLAMVPRSTQAATLASAA